MASYIYIFHRFKIIVYKLRATINYDQENKLSIWCYLQTVKLETNVNFCHPFILSKYLREGKSEPILSTIAKNENISDISQIQVSLQKTRELPSC
jgi:hypothetical protein